MRKKKSAYKTNYPQGLFAFLFFSFLLSSACSAQRTDTVSGKVFVQLKHGLCRDLEHNIYFYSYDTVSDWHIPKDVILKTGTKKTFRLRDYIDTAGFYRPDHFPFAWDTKHVYFFYCYGYDTDLDTAMMIVQDADPATFRIHENSEYEAEDRHADYYWKKNTLEVISKTMKYKDLGKGFYRGGNGKMYIKTCVNTDPGGTDIPSAGFYREVPDIDVKTYTDFGQMDGYAKDKNKVYWRWLSTDGMFIKTVEGADPATFVIDPVGGDTRSYAHDKNFRIEQGIPEKK